MSFTISAQESIMSSFKKGFNKLDVGVHAGGCIGITDLKRYKFYPSSSSSNYNELKGGGGITFGYTINQVHYIKSSFSSGSIGGYLTKNQLQSFVQDPENPDHDVFSLDGIMLNNDFVSLDLAHFLNLEKFLIPKHKRLIAKSRNTSINTIIGLNWMFYRSYVTPLNNQSILSRDQYGSVMYRGYDDVMGTITNPEDLIKKQRVRDISLMFGLQLNQRISRKYIFNTGFKYFISESDNIDGWSIDKSDMIVSDKYSYLYFGITYRIRNKIIYDEWTSPIDELYYFKDEVEYKIEGLMTDVDQDGVSDHFDKELNTPSGSVVDGTGVSIDSDSDGVMDLYDKERFSNLGAVVNEYGVEYDDDEDGIPNSKDLDSDTKLGELVDINGRAIRLDYDPTTLANGVSAISNGFLPSIYFDDGSSVVNSEQYKLLASVVQTLLKNPELDLVVVGHTDSRGTVDNNEVLGYKRAAEVVRILTAVFGVPLERFEIQTRGETQPLALPPAISVEVETPIIGIDDQLSEINRRVDFEIAE